MLDLIARPFGLLVMWLYDITGNYLLSVVLFALIVKLILLPFQMKSKKGMMRTSTLNPQLQELAKKHGANKAKYNEEVQKLYREEGINPMSGCLWSLLPFPILLALYLAIRKPLTIMMGVSSSLLADGGAIAEKLTQLGFSPTGSGAYLEISQAKFITEHFSEFEGISSSLKPLDYNCFGLDLGSEPSWQLWNFDWSSPSVWGPALALFFIPIVAAFLTWLTTKISMKMSAATPPPSADGTAAKPNSGMMIIGPLMTLWFGFMMPASLGMYWIASSFFSIIQEIILNKHYGKIIAAEAAERNAARAAREAELEAKRAETERLRAQNATMESENTSKRKQQKKKKQAQSERALEWQRQKDGTEPAYEPSRVGNRKYARGRSYDPDRFAYNGVVGATSDVSEIDESLTEIEDKLDMAARADTEEPREALPDSGAPQAETGTQLPAADGPDDSNGSSGSDPEDEEQEN